MRSIVLSIVFLLCGMACYVRGQGIRDGYTDKLSYRAGDTVTFFINGSSSGNVNLNLYTMNQTTIAETVPGFFTALISQKQPTPADEAWKNGYNYIPYAKKWVVPSTLRSGMYLINNRIPAIIKGDKNKADIVIVCPTNTMEAYNNNGGRNLYMNKKKEFSSVISFHRPFSPGGEETFISSFLQWIYPVYSTGSSRTINVISDMDMDDYSEIRKAKLLIVIGHSEYWTRKARENFDHFVDEGRDVLVLSGDMMGWQVRYSDDKSQLICYRGLISGYVEDPMRFCEPMLNTIRWIDTSLHYSVLNSIGVDWTHGGFGTHSNGFGGYRILLPGSPLLAGLTPAVRKGDTVSCVTHEYDGTLISGDPKSNNPVLNVRGLGFYRADLIGFDRSTSTGYWRVCPFMAFQRTCSSGKIINLSSTDWCGIRGIGGPDSVKIREITQNMIDKLLTNSNIFVSPAPSGLNLGTSHSNVSCHGRSDGAINLTACGGTGTYSYYWSNGSTTQDISRLSGGTYRVTVTDTHTATASAAVIITEYTSLSLTTSQKMDKCYGKIDLTVCGGTGNYAYLWNNAQTIAEISGLLPGNYAVSVTDANGCAVSSQIILTQPAGILKAIVGTSGTTSFCYGDSLTLTAAPNGTARYLWNNGSAQATITVKDPGSYAVTLTYFNGCVCSSDPVLVTVYPLPAKPVITASGNIFISSANAGNQWFLNGRMINGDTGKTCIANVAGMYKVRVTNSNGCVNISDSIAHILSSAVNITGESITSAIVPNPFSQTTTFTYTLPNSVTTAFLKVYDLKGALLRIYPLDPQEHNLTISADDYENGVYLYGVDEISTTKNKMIVAK